MEKIKKIRKTSDAKLKANKKWNDENTKNGSFQIRKELFEAMEKYCNEYGYSKNGLITELFKERLKSVGMWDDEQGDKMQ